MKMAYNNWRDTDSFDNSVDLFDDSFDDEDYLTSLDITEPRVRDRHRSFDAGERDATNDNNKNEQSKHKEASASAMRNDTIDITESFLCPFCESVEDNVYSLENHIATAHPEMTMDERKARPSSNQTSLRFGQRDDPHGLYAEDDDDKSLLVCPYCEMRLECEFTVNEHIDTVHKEELQGTAASSSGTVECPVCNEPFSSEIELETHVQWHFSAPDLYNSPSSSFRSSHSDQRSECPVCEFCDEDYAILSLHVESHFDPHHAPGPSKNSQQSSPSGSEASSSRNGHNSHPQRKTQVRGRNAYQNQYRQNLEKSVLNGHISPGEYHEMMTEMRRSHQLGIDEGHSKVEGMYENLAAAYRLHRQAPHVILCDPTDYYCGSYGDKGWGCGFRNFQMMLSCLARIPVYAEKLFPDGDIQVPSVCKLQKIIEGAWQKGFDREGCIQLGGKLVNTRKWIGATEVVATLASMDIKCTLADFHRPSAADGSHPKLLEWVYDYFLQDSEHKPPLYLQHQGHSRTIAGIENDNGVLKLVMFDPGTPYNRVAHLAQRPLEPKQLRTFRRTVAAFKAKQYQIVAVTGILTPTEYEENKILQSVQVS